MSSILSSFSSPRWLGFSLSPNQAGDSQRKGNAGFSSGKRQMRDRDRGRKKEKGRRVVAKLTLQHRIVELRDLLSIVRNLSLSSNRNPGSSILAVGDVDVLGEEEERSKRGSARARPRRAFPLILQRRTASEERLTLSFSIPSIFPLSLLAKKVNWSPSVEAGRQTEAVVRRRSANGRAHFDSSQRGRGSSPACIALE